MERMAFFVSTEILSVYVSNNGKIMYTYFTHLFFTQDGGRKGKGKGRDHTPIKQL